MKLYERFEKKPTLPLTFGLGLILVGLFSEQIDLFFSRIFFKEDLFHLKDNEIFYALNHVLPVSLVLLSFIFLLLGLFQKIERKKMIFLFGSMLTGPLLITNALFKTMWGRARPFQIIEFNGDKHFSSALIPSDQCSWDCSFVSGHTAVAMWTLSLALLCPVKYRNLAIIFSLFFTVLVGMSRIVQGYHFFSDVLFAAVINFYVVWFFYTSVYLEKKTSF
ncbi:MAG: phosphatase PAP2 family protein [Alphaproteobacteria bacterium]|nr:phosphatase PAP2 family protein [Alphaproteobacteria bacterium]